jgi:predicted O-methyltransferase YrrM
MNPKLLELTKGLAYLSTAEAEYLMGLVQMLPANPTVVNIGAGAGTSGLAIYTSRDDVYLYTIDVNQHSPLGCLDGERDAFKGAGLEGEPRHYMLLGDSGKVASTWGHGMVDMVFVDDGHHAPDVIRDIQSWMPFIKEGGIIAFHDYGADAWPDVKAQVDRLVGAEQEKIGQVETIAAFLVYNIVHYKTAQCTQKCIG